MAIFHLSVKVISRSKGKSAVGAAAYRSSEKIENAYDGVVHDYTRKRGIIHTQILLPFHAPAKYYNRSVLWNAVEKAEKAKNSQLARDIEISLPRELPFSRQKQLVIGFVRQTFVNEGMCADICFHDKLDGNPHAHIMLTMRPINEDGSWGQKQKKVYVLDGSGNKIYDKKKLSNVTVNESEPDSENEITIKVEGMMCEHCEKRVRDALEALEEVETATPNHTSGTVKLTLKGETDLKKIKKAVSSAGYKMK